MYGTVLMAMGWFLSAVAMLHMWRRNDLNYVRSAFWTIVLVLPWGGAAVYAAWRWAPASTSVVLTMLGALGVHDVVRPSIDFVRSRDWAAASLVTCDENFEWGFDGSSTVSPRYAYIYEGVRYEGTRLSFMKPPWQESVFKLDCRSAHAFVNPSAPGESVLHRIPPNWILKRCAVMLLMICAGCWLAWDHWRARSRSSA